MAFNINEISGVLTGGGARPSLFQAFISSPGGIIPNIQFLCRATTLPESSVGQIDIPYFGRKIHVAGNRTYRDWSITVMNDEDFLIRHEFERWLSIINGVQTNTGAVSPAEYRTDASVVQYSKDGSPIRQYDFANLFPTEISSISVDWNTTDQIEEFSVTFQYDFFTVSGGPGTIGVPA